MMISRQIAHILRDLCPALSAEGMAAALGIQLLPTPCAAYRYRRSPPSVVYDALAAPAEQERAVRRAVVLYMLDVLDLSSALREERTRGASFPSIIALIDDVFAQLRSASFGKRSA